MNQEESDRKWYTVRRDDFKLTCDCLHDVSRQHPRVPYLVYALYRLVLALYFVGFLIYSGVDGADFLGVKFLIYLTDWTFIVVTVYLLITFINVLFDSRRKRSEDLKGSLRHQIQWFFYNVSATVSLIVTTVYWTALRPFMSEKLPIYLDITIHLLPALVCIIDLFLTVIVVRFVHVVYPFAYLLVYLIFALIYWAAGGTDPVGNPFIYPIIDFGNYPGIAAASVVGVCLATLLAQAALKGLYALRVRFLDRRTSRGSVVSQSNEVLEVELENGNEWKRTQDETLMATSTTIRDSEEEEK